MAPTLADGQPESRPQGRRSRRRAAPLPAVETERAADDRRACMWLRRRRVHRASLIERRAGGRVLLGGGTASLGPALRCPSCQQWAPSGIAVAVSVTWASPPATGPPRRAAGLLPIGRFGGSSRRAVAVLEFARWHLPSARARASRRHQASRGAACLLTGIDTAGSPAAEPQGHAACFACQAGQ